MNMNAVADQVQEILEIKHSRAYRNKAPKKVIFPYVVYRIESVMNTIPSEDLYLNIDIYEDINNSVRDMEDLADSIDNDLNQKIINTDLLNLYFDREARQYINDEELIGTHLINLRYVMRAYFK
jgi:hypothetical protein